MLDIHEGKSGHPSVIRQVIARNDRETALLSNHVFYPVVFERILTKGFYRSLRVLLSHKGQAWDGVQVIKCQLVGL